MKRTWVDIWPAAVWQEYRAAAPLVNDEEGLIILRQLDAHIPVYHTLQKTDRAQVLPRAQMLRFIAGLCRTFLIGKEGRVEVKKSGHSTQWARRLPNAPADRSQLASRAKGVGRHTVFEGISQKVYSLGRRANLKANYLEALDVMLGQPGNGAGANPDEFVNLLRSPQSADGFGLHRGVQLEFVDPAHREFEMEAGNALSICLHEWRVSLAQHNLPFFLWMEVHPLTVHKGFAKQQEISPVKYLTNEERQAFLLTAGDGYLNATGLGGRFHRFGGGDRFHTLALAEVADWLGFAAFVLSPAGEWFGFEHEPGSMHHSSALGGGTVATAGMIRVNDGKVESIANKSGHYRPTPQSLIRPVEFLQGQGVLAPNFTVQVIDAEAVRLGRPHRFSIDEFFQRYRFNRVQPGAAVAAAAAGGRAPLLGNRRHH